MANSMDEDVKFGTSGLRGLADQLLAGSAYRYALAFCKILQQADAANDPIKVLVGRDKRPSSPQLSAQVIQAVSDAGLKAVDCGQVPTPALAFAAQRQAAGAIMVTGSHIPSDRNGLKFYDLGGEITKAGEQLIAARTRDLADRVPSPPDLSKPSMTDVAHDHVLGFWHDRYRGLMPKDTLNRLRVGVLVGSSIAAESLCEILAGYGATIVEFGVHEHFAPLDTEAVDEKALAASSTAQAEHDLDGVVSTDPDGDRPLVIAEDGQILRGDLLGWITAHWLGADHVSTTVNANSAIRTNEGLGVDRTRIGSPFVIESISQAQANGAQLPVGFEPNGGFLLGGNATIHGKRLLALATRDSFLPILATLSAAAKNAHRLSELRDRYRFKAMASDRLKDVEPGTSAALINRLRTDETARHAFFESFGRISAIDWTDGMRVTLQLEPGSVSRKKLAANDDRVSDRIIHLRPSGNAPELRCYVEGDEADWLLAAALNRLRGMLDRSHWAL